MNPIRRVLDALAFGVLVIGGLLAGLYLCSVDVVMLLVARRTLRKRN